MRSPVNLHRRGVRGAASPPVEERVQNFRKEVLRFEEMAIPGEFWDMLMVNVYAIPDNFVEIQWTTLKVMLL